MWLLALSFALCASAAQADPREDLERAKDSFLVTDYESALRTVRSLIASGALQGTDLRDAYVLQARCELAFGRPSASNDAFCNALHLDPSWKPDDGFTAEENAAFRRAAPTCATDRGLVVKPGADTPSYLPGPVTRGTAWYKRPKYLGVIAGAVAVAAVLAFSGGDEDAAVPTLGSYPDPPPSN